jgi:hypothetical protein
MNENNNLTENLLSNNNHISTFRIIYEQFTNKINSIEGVSIKDNEICDEDIIFIADNIIENNNIVCVEGSIGYEFDRINIKLIYDLQENKIYIASSYRLLGHELEHELFKDTFQMSYDKEWVYEKEKENENLNQTENYILKKKIISENYKKFDEIAIPYYRFPRTKDGITIPRLIYNIFKVFSDENAIKPDIIIPNSHNVYYNTYSSAL